MLAETVGVACLTWYCLLPLVCITGYVQIYRHYRSRSPKAKSEQLPHHDVPHITVIRPIRGVETELYQCLASTFRQSYPHDKLTIRLCLPSRNDPGSPIAEQVLQDFPGFDARTLYEDEDEVLTNGALLLGPNPKIRNMSRAYREAKGDLVWIIDCNVWVAKGVAGRMVDTIEGCETGVKYKFVHQLPLVEDVTTAPESIGQSLTGSRIEEMFLASSHAKFYTAINTVLIAPCIVGKSNMFRRSHLNELTARADGSRPPGIDFFSYNICEDHLIGDLLWKNKVQEEASPTAKTLGKHSMVFGELAVQPLEGMSVSAYWNRRGRWLRVRKFTVPAATFVEPFTECFLQSIVGAYAFTTLPWAGQRFGIDQSWTSFAAFCLLHSSIWALMDWTLFRMLHSMASIEMDENTPGFVRRNQGRTIRSFGEFMTAWLARESLAFPVWFWAVICGVTVDWRGQRFRVGFDARVRALESRDAADRPSHRNRPRLSGPSPSLERLSRSSTPKARRD